MEVNVFRLLLISRHLVLLILLFRIKFDTYGMQVEFDQFIYPFAAFAYSCPNYYLCNDVDENFWSLCWIIYLNFYGGKTAYADHMLFDFIMRVTPLIRSTSQSQIPFSQSAVINF